MSVAAAAAPAASKPGLSGAAGLWQAAAREVAPAKKSGWAVKKKPVGTT